MMFNYRIKGIGKNDRVLEVGPGENPYHRSDVLLEKRYDSQDEYQAQIGFVKKNNINKSIIYYDGGSFPFKDHEFDYVICSHVLEHIDDVPLFISELTRVAKSGYLEYPTIYYEYLYNFKVHKNYLFFDGVQLKWMKKAETGLVVFSPVNDFFLQSLTYGYDALVFLLRDYFFQGFEWQKSISCLKAESIDDLCLERNKLELIPKQGKISQYFYFFKKMAFYLKNKFHR